MKGVESMTCWEEPWPIQGLSFPVLTDFFSLPLGPFPTTFVLWSDCIKNIWSHQTLPSSSGSWAFSRGSPCVSETFFPAPHLYGLLLSFQVLRWYHFPWKFFPDSQVCVKGPSLTCTSSTAAHKLLRLRRLLTRLHLPLRYGEIPCLCYSPFAVGSYCSVWTHSLLFRKTFYRIQLVRTGLLSS